MCVCVGQVIRLTFTKIDVELSESCEYDQLSVYDGDDDQCPTIGVYCGKLTPQELIQSNGTTLFLTFTSDTADAGQGFVVNWQAVDNIGQYRPIIRACVHQVFVTCITTNYSIISSVKTTGEWGPIHRRS